MNVTWIKSRADTWLEFRTFDMSTVPATSCGVYVIWHGGSKPKAVYVGQGTIKSRLTAHRANATIVSYSRYAPLYVTWAVVPASQMDGIERYLADTLRPLVGDAHPNALPIAVNIP